MSRFTLTIGDKKNTMCRPVYGVNVEMSEGTRYLDRRMYRALSDGDTRVPCEMSEYVFADDKLAKAYGKVWIDYSAAQRKMVALLNSYNTREKFIADFPEFEKYLPKLAEKAKLPVVQVSKVRAELSKLGVPQQC